MDAVWTLVTFLLASTLWAIIGLVAWLSFLTRTTTAYVAVALAAALTNNSRALNKAREALREATLFYGNGFRIIYAGTYGAIRRGDPASQSEFNWAALASHAAWTIGFLALSTASHFYYTHLREQAAAAEAKAKAAAVEAEAKAKAKEEQERETAKMNARSFRMLVNGEPLLVLPVKIERELTRHPAVRDAVVIRVPSTKYTLKPVAMVVLHEQLAVDAVTLQNWANKQCGSGCGDGEYLLQGVAFVPRIPRNDDGVPNDAEVEKLAAAQTWSKN